MSRSCKTTSSGPTQRRRAAVALGVAAETFVCGVLLQEGWHILARNWRGAGAELDIVALQDGVVRVVEVKARTNSDPLAAITPAKCRRLIRGAKAFLADLDDPWEEVSFSIALVDAGELEWLHDAFDA